MKWLQTVRHPVETLRAAPFGASLAGMNIASMVWGMENFDDYAHFYGPAVSAGILAMNGLTAAIIGGSMVKRQLDLKERLENSIEAHGFNERVMAKTTDEWCNRQTAKVVCGKYNLSPEYENLLQQHTENARLLWLPHI